MGNIQHYIFFDIDQYFIYKTNCAINVCLKSSAVADYTTIP